METTRHLAGAVVAAYDFSGIKTLVDVGGGYGVLLASILEAYPNMSGTVIDMAHCEEGANRLLQERGLTDRARFVEGDFFDSVTPGADAYIIKSVIHDWDDDRSIAILSSCRAAMRDESRLLIVEPVAPDKMGASPLDGAIAANDLNMLVNTGGKERTRAEFEQIISASGLQLTNVIPTQGILSILEAVPA